MALMSGMHWLPWLLLAVPLGIALLFWWAWKSYRRDVRRGFVLFLLERHPNLEVHIEHEGCVAVRSEQGVERVFCLHELYKAVARLEKDTPEARKQAYERYLDHADPPFR